MERNTGSDQISMELEANQVFGLIGGLIVLQLLLLVAFFKSINPDYIRTFYSFVSGNQYVVAKYFCKNDNDNDDEDEDEDEDEKKIEIFEVNRNKWRSIEADVAKWIGEKIPEWNEEQPEWWDARRKSEIPDWIVHDPELLSTVRTEDVQNLLATSGRASTQAYDNYAGVKRLPSSRMLATSLISIRGGESGRQQVFDADTIRRRNILAKASQELTAVIEAL